MTIEKKIKPRMVLINLFLSTPKNKNYCEKGGPPCQLLFATSFFIACFGSATLLRIKNHVLRPPIASPVE